MDIEYKVTAQDQLAIKQARPWVSFWADITSDNDLAVSALVNPQSSSSLGSNELVEITVANYGLNAMSDFDLELMIDGQSVETMSIDDTIEPFSEANFQFTIPQDFSAVGEYNLSGIVLDGDDEYGSNDTLNVVLSKLKALDGELSIGQLAVACDEVVEVNAIVSNNGENTITDVVIEVVVNEVVVETIDAAVNIPYLEQGAVWITIDENLQQSDNDITLNLLNVNSQSDEDETNNSAFANTDLVSDYDVVTVIINTDNYPGETTWDVVDESTGQTIASGGVGSVGAGSVFSEDICLNYASCFSFIVYDSFGDGICCAYGEGNFLVLNSAGETIASNDGDFGSQGVELFCPDGAACEISADISITNASSELANDGTIAIFTNSGVGPFTYSIDGGETFFASNTFTGLATGEYDVFVQSSVENCFFEETVFVQACEFLTADIEYVYPSSVVSANGFIEIIPTSGVGPYEYSIDGGQNFVSTNVFPDLPVGDYNVVVKDALDICLYEATAPLGVCFVLANIVSVDASSESASDGSISIVLSEGLGPFQYSIDGGENFFGSNEFTNLSAGVYDVVVLDFSGNCTYEETITIETDVLSISEDNSPIGIKVYPNPTSNEFNVEVESFSWHTGTVTIEVYDNLGRTIQSSSISPQEREISTISLQGYDSGTYFVKCFNSTFEKNFKVVKINGSR